MATECPTVAELLAAVKSLTREKEGTFQEAWSDSFPDTTHCAEQGGFIYIDFPVPDRLTRAFITRAPAGKTMNQKTEGPNASIDLNKPGIKGDNLILVANFHTHPLSTEVHGDPEPSQKDRENAYFRGIPGIVISRKGLYSYGPENRRNLTNPKGYPGPVTAPAIIPAKHELGPPPPWKVKNQWEGDDLLDEQVGSKAQVDEQGECDVIVLEWSGEGVEYGEPLKEC